MKNVRKQAAMMSSVAVIVVLCGSRFTLANIQIYGGPVYDSSTGSGFRYASMPPSSVTRHDNGMSIGAASKFAPGQIDLGPRAIRFDPNGWTELDALNTRNDGYAWGEAKSINSSGAAVGFFNKYSADTDIGVRAVRWDAGSTAATELGNLGTSTTGYTRSYAYGINEAGTAVGDVLKYNSSGQHLGQFAVRWDAGSATAIELGGVVGTGNTSYGTTSARAINASGTMIGTATKRIDGRSIGDRAVRWDAGMTTATALGDLGEYLDGRSTTMAYALNEGGTAVGFAEKWDGASLLGRRAVRWDAGSTNATELGNIGTTQFGFTESFAFSVNAAGTSVGYARKYGEFSRDLGHRAVRWDAGGTIATELGSLGATGEGFAWSNAAAINDSGIAVGAAGVTGVGPRAVYWGLDAVAVDLNTLLSLADAFNWTLTSATGISNTNWITGIGAFDPDGPAGALPAYERMFLVQIPTPGAAATLALAAGLAITKRRRR